MLGGEEGRGPEQGQELPPWRNRSSSGDRGGPGGRIPPHNIEAERSVLGAILINNTSLSYVLDTGLESRDFYTQAHQKIFECEMALSERGEPVDMITLQSALRDRGWYEVVGGTEALTKLFEDTFAVGNITKYAKIVREKAILRRVIECAGEIGAGAFEPIEDTEEFLDEAERKMLSVADTKLTKTFSSIKDVLVKNIETIEMLSQRKSEVVGLPTGFHDFDRLTSGLRGGQLVIIAARPAMGKTSLFLSAVQNISLTGPNVCALFSLEMSDEELVTRLLAGAAKIDSRRLKTGRLADRDWQRLAGAADQLSQAKIFIDDSGDLTVMDIRARCRRLLTVEKRLDLIVVDYLQLMKGSKGASRDGNREREISEISRNLKSLARELNVPIIALSQLNRGLEQRPNKRPMLSDLRESGAIEQDADMVCFIYRDEVYNAESEDKGVAEIIVGKHRGGETATIRLAWLAEYTLFANLAKDAPMSGGAPIVPIRPEKGDDPFM